MDNKELRLGNLVRVAGADYKVLMIGERKDLIKLESIGIVAIKTVKPTPLTPDILNIFGFDKQVYGHYLNLGYDDVMGTNLGIFITEKMEVAVVMGVDGQDSEDFENYVKFATKHPILSKIANAVATICSYIR